MEMVQGGTMQSLVKMLDVRKKEKQEISLSEKVNQRVSFVLDSVCVDDQVYRKQHCKHCTAAC